MEKKYKNGLGIASLIFYIIGLTILGIGSLLAYLEGDPSGGWGVVFAMYLGGGPLMISGCLAIVNICKYYSKKSINKCSKFFVVFDWFVIATIMVPYLAVYIYSILMTIFS